MRSELICSLVAAACVVAAPPAEGALCAKQSPPYTVALVEQNAARQREIPTWLAIIAIVSLSLVAGIATYFVRVSSSGSRTASTTTSSSVAYERPAEQARLRQP